jgi:cell division protein FtsA
MICILDLGTSKISSILVKDEDLSPEVIAFSSVETSGIKTGSIINISQISEDISKCINELEDKSGEKIKDIIVSFSGEQISSINSTGSVIIRQKEVTARDVQSALNMSSTLKVPNDKTLLFVSPNEYIIDGQPGIAQPIGMNGVRLEAKSHLIYCSQNTKENISKCIEELNDLRIKKFYYNQLGAAESVLTKDQRELGVCLLDIGAGTTDLTIYKGGSKIFQKFSLMQEILLLKTMPAIS